MSRSIKHIYEFGPFRLDATERLLLRDGRHIPLTLKAFEMLLVLVENGGHVIDKDQMIKKIWPDTPIEEANLARNIYSLRKILGGEQYIETIPKRGYRFIAGVKEVWSDQVFPWVSGEGQGKEGIETDDPANRMPVSGSTGFLTARGPDSDSLLRQTLGNRLALPLVFLVLGVVLSVAVWFIISRTFSNTSVSHLTMVPLTSFQGTEEQAAFSPDGNKVAFVWNGENEDNDDIYVKLIGTETAIRLTTDSAIDTDPAWSPDGRYLAFLRRSAETVGLFLVPAFGGSERKLADTFPYRPVVIGNTLSYSPDGKYLAVPDKQVQDEPFSIFLVSIETGEKIKLTSPPAGSVGDYFPVFSPDERTLAFVRSHGIAEADIYLLPLAGGSPKQLTFDNTFIRGLSWTSDGRGIVFASKREGSKYNLWKISIGGSVPEQLTVSQRDTYSPAVSRHGNRLAYTQSSLDENIWRFGLNHSLPAREHPVKLIASTQDENSPEFSPDSKKIVFISNRSGSHEIWVCESDGSHTRQLTNTGASLTGTPRWSPDGRHIAFNSCIEGNNDVYTINIDGGKPRRLTFDQAEDVTPSWSRDSRWIYFGSTRSGSMQIWKVPATGGEAIGVTRRGGFEGFESTDGQYFYFTKGRALPGIWRVPVSGGEETMVLDHHRAGFWRYWAVTDKGIYFATANTPPHPIIEFFNFATRKISFIATLDKPLLRTTPGLTVSPDGKWLLVPQIDRSDKDIMLVENFR